METKQQDKLVMAKVSAHGVIVLPLEQAMQVVNLVMRGERYDYEYVDDGTQTGNKVRLESITAEAKCGIEVMNEAEYLLCKLNGEGRGAK